MIEALLDFVFRVEKAFSFRKKKSLPVGGILLLLCGACASTDRPTREMIYASAALKAADRAQAEKRSPDLYRRAENSFWKAKRYYLGKEYRDAAKSAVESRRLSEAAEMDAEIKDSLSASSEGW